MIRQLFVCCFMLFSFATLAQAQIKATLGAEKPIVGQNPKLFKKLNIKGARGETVNFILHFDHKSRDKITVSKFNSKNTNKKVSFDVKFFEPYPLEVREDTKSFKSAKTGIYYDPLVPILKETYFDSSVTPWVFGEIVIPRKQAAGTYTSKISFAGKTIRVNLEVWKMTMPQVPTLPMYSEIHPNVVHAGHYAEWFYDFSELDMNLYRSYIKELADHHVYPTRAWDYTALEPPVRYKNKEILDVFSNPSVDNSFYSNLVSTVPNGIYYDFPSPRFGPAGFGHFSDMSEVDEFASYFQAMQNTTLAIGRKKKAMTFLWDEPFMNAYLWQSETDATEDLALVQEYTSKVKTWAPNVKVMLTSPCFKQLENSVDIFAAAPNYMEKGYAIGGNFKDCEYLQSKGHEIWWYVSCMSHGCSDDSEDDDPGTPDVVIERPSSYIRSLAWLQGKYNFSAFFYFDLVYSYEFSAPEDGSIDPWKTIYYFTGNGDGSFVYPGRIGEYGFTSEQPVASIRLKQWRETSFDAEYINWMKKQAIQPSWWKKEFGALVKSSTNWNKNYEKYQALRNKIGKYLNTIN